MLRKICLDNIPKTKSGRNSWVRASEINALVNFVYDDVEGFVKIIDHQTDGSLIIEYDGKLHRINYKSFTNCCLGKVLGKYTSDFKVNIKETFKCEKRNITIIDRKHKSNKHGTSTVNDKYYKYHCNICHNEDWMLESALIDKVRIVGCSCCSGKKTVLGVNSIWDTDKWMCGLGVSEEDAKKYTRSSSKCIGVKCPYCGERKSLVISNIFNNKSIGCSKCGTRSSYPEKFMYNMLKQLGVEFETEYSPMWIKPRRYDFYIPSVDLIIEVDGGWHFKDNNMSKQTKEEMANIDNVKDNLASENNKKLVRINCKKSEPNYIKTNIINSEINSILDLSNIDWVKCEENAMTSLCKMVCEYSTNNNVGVPDICKVFKLSEPAIRKYLRKGTALGWCNYSPNLYGKIGIYILKDNIILGEFESARDLCRKSKDLFGEEFNYRIISKVLNKQQASYKGYTFKYKKDEEK